MTVNREVEGQDAVLKGVQASVSKLVFPKEVYMTKGNAAEDSESAEIRCHHVSEREIETGET